MLNKEELYKVATEASQAQSTLYIWPDMTLFIGPLQSLSLHAMQTTAINVGLYQPLTLSTEDGQSSSHRCAMIGAGQKHELAANGGIVASLLIERNSSAYHHLPQNNACPARAITPISAAKWVDYLQMIAEVKPTKAVIYNLLKRFRHLFREQSDTPFRRYRLWRRIISAMEALHNENNITQAAMAAGFSDSAHFNRCFQQAFGLNPSRLFRHMDKVKP